MQIYKCDRCGKIVNREERCCAHVEGNIADLCEVCYTEFVRDRDAIDRLYSKNRKALAQKFGMLSIHNILGGNE